MDFISNGRAAWNVVTNAGDAAAQNFGLDALPPRELRYDMAEEYMDLVYRLWDSWAEDAIVMNRETATYADFRKVNTINFEGKYFKSRGPLNTVRPPQGRPTLVQAGGSPKGRDFAAKHADSIIAVSNGIPAMIFCAEIRACPAPDVPPVIPSPNGMFGGDHITRPLWSNPNRNGCTDTTPPASRGCV